MQSVGKNIKYQRKKAHLSQEDLANMLQLSTKAISSWEIDRTEPSSKKLKELCSIFQCSCDELLFGGDVASLVHVPLYDDISCGNGSFVLDVAERTVFIPSSLLGNHKKYFAQYAQGDSMIEEHIQEGDLLIFEQCDILENGEIGCFVIDEDVATCKKYYRDLSSNVILLQPANSSYSPIIVSSDSIFRIIGRLHTVIRRY